MTVRDHDIAITVYQVNAVPAPADRDLANNGTHGVLQLNAVSFRMIAQDLDARDLELELPHQLRVLGTEAAVVAEAARLRLGRKAEAYENLPR